MQKQQCWLQLPSLTHPAGRNFIGLKIEKAFSSAHRTAQTMKVGVGFTSWGCRSFWVLTESQGQPWLLWTPAESVLVGLEAVPASSPSPLAQTSVCVQFACVLWLNLAGGRHMPSSLQLPAEWSTADPPLPPEDAFIWSYRTTGQGHWSELSVESCSEPAELQ